MKTKKIFIALPHYNYPNSLMDYGVHLAKALERSALLIGIEKMPVPMMPTAAGTGNLIVQDTVTMDDVVDAVEPRLEHLRIRAKEIWTQTDADLEIGFPESKLEEMAEEQHPYLTLVQGKSDLDTLNEWFGTYETRIAENIESPVLVIPEKNPWRPLENILYMMDVNDHAVENMRILSDIAKATNANITVAVISSKEDEVMEKNAKYLRMVKTFRQFLGYDKMTYMQVFSDDAAESIQELVKDKQADWLAFQHKNQSFFSRIFDDNNTEHLILQSTIPVLVF